ncbi:Uncharacterised protein [Edwardsiella tarda]|nr:Uncharacterised protein [Edwardsiella tarda]
MYATIQDMRLSFGERECSSLADPDYSGGINEPVMEARYSVPVLRSMVIWWPAIPPPGQIPRAFW